VDGSPARLLSLLYLAGPSLPVGAFAWSQGLEGACAEGTVRDAASLKARLLTVLRFGLERFDLPVLLRCYAAAAGRNACECCPERPEHAHPEQPQSTLPEQPDRARPEQPQSTQREQPEHARPERTVDVCRRHAPPQVRTEEFLYWDRLLLAGRESAELLQEEKQTGYALCRLLREQGLWPEDLGEHSCGYTAAFALAAALLAPDPGDGQDAACAYAWSRMENQAVAACRCMPLGQRAVQRVLLDIMPEIPASVERAALTPDEDIGACLPGAVLASCRHERQYSRLFRS
jgi:urease accessory protein